MRITRSLILVLFERASVVKYACQISSCYLLWSKCYHSKGSSWQQTEKQTKQDKNNMPPIIWSGGIRQVLTHSFSVQMVSYLPLEIDIIIFSGCHGFICKIYGIEAECHCLKTNQILLSNGVPYTSQQIDQQEEQSCSKYAWKDKFMWHLDFDPLSKTCYPLAIKRSVNIETKYPESMIMCWFKNQLLSKY